MKKAFLRFLYTLALGAGVAAADTASYAGSFSSPESPVDFTVTLMNAGAVTLQTYGFGGGANAKGTMIAPGGTDPFLAIFSGTGAAATILTDGMGNPLGTSLDLSNYGNPDFLGCPPAGAPVIGGSPQCGDIMMSLVLPKGTYTVVLSDGQYIVQAVFDNGTLGEDFADLTGGGFCNAVINGVDCPNTSGAYALDITTPGSASSVPEPATYVPLAVVWVTLVWMYRRRIRVSAAQHN